jgi:hypothetical protein
VESCESDTEVRAFRGWKVSTTTLDSRNWRRCAAWVGRTVGSAGGLFVRTGRPGVQPGGVEPIPAQKQDSLTPARMGRAGGMEHVSTSGVQARQSIDSSRNPYGATLGIALTVRTKPPTVPLAQRRQTGAELGRGLESGSSVACAGRTVAGLGGVRASTGRPLALNLAAPCSTQKEIHRSLS